MSETPLQPDKENNCLIVDNDTEIRLYNENGGEMELELDHSSQMDGYVAFTDMNGENITMGFTKHE